MGDRVSIPRSFSGNIGVEDALPSIRRHYMPLPLAAPLNTTTTGGMFGGDSNTTGIAWLARNITLERLFVVGFKQTTVNNNTTLTRLVMHKNGASTLFDLVITNSTTLGLQWHANSTTPAIANIISTDRISARIALKNEMTSISATLVFRERADS